jgi:replicative DNA helicase
VSQYYDSAAAIQAIGCCFNNPSLLDAGSGYTLSDTDFVTDFHRVVFASIANLHNAGAENIGIKTIEDYLAKRPKSLAIYKDSDGSNWLMKVLKEAQPTNFDYYYNRVKKMSLLRGYNDIGMDVSFILDEDNVFDIAMREEQEKKLNAMSLQDIADEVENRIVRIKEVIVDNDSDESCQIGDGLENLVERLKDEPVRGYPLFDRGNNIVTMGGRLGTFYLRSASTGVGKSRTAMADACFLACDRMWDNGQWVSIGEKIPTVFISVELDKEELQTMALAFISGVPENHILEQQFDFEEVDRVAEAIKILNESKLFIEYLPDYSMMDIENCIKRNIRVNKTSAVFLDYIATSMKMMEELKRNVGSMVAREDQALFLLATKIKDIAQKYGVFIYSSTQLSNNFKGERILDQGMLAGAKAIANRVDVGEIMVDMTPQDLEEIKPLLDANPGLGTPNVKMSIYKNRRGKFNRIILWMKADKSTCRYETIFATDYNYTLINLEA